MTKRTLPGVLAVLCVLGLGGEARAASGVAWAKSFQDALSQSKKSGKLVFADFYTDW